VEETRNQVAVRRGPLIYCLESVDLPPEVRLDQIGLSGDIVFQPKPAAGALRGLVMLEGKALATRDGAWGQQLYRERRTTATQPLNLRLAPYYAWGNRGKSEMTVWLPLIEAY
jgi:DUF1680 family protein